MEILCSRTILFFSRAKVLISHDIRKSARKLILTLCSIFADFLVKSDFRTFKKSRYFGPRKLALAYNARESTNT